MRKLLKIWLALIILILPFITSVLYFDIFQNKVKVYKFNVMTSEIKNPLPPGVVNWFGTDRFGASIFMESWHGYRITFIFVIGIVLISFIIAVILGSYLAFRKGTVDIVTDGFLNAYYFIPQAIVTYMLLFPVLTAVKGKFSYDMTFRIGYMLIVIALVMVPTTMAVVRDQVRQVLNTEYMDAATVIGASKTQKLIRHVYPNIKNRLLIIFVRMLYQVLMVLSHISFFRIFFGGTKTCDGFEACLGNDFTLIMPELTTLLGFHMTELYSSWWTFMVPCTFVVLILIAIQMLADALETEYKSM